MDRLISMIEKRDCDGVYVGDLQSFSRPEPGTYVPEPGILKALEIQKEAVCISFHTGGHSVLAVDIKCFDIHDHRIERSMLFEASHILSHRDRN